MSGFRIVEAKVGRKTVYQVFLGQQPMGDPRKSRQDAESYIDLLKSKSSYDPDSVESK